MLFSDYRLSHLEAALNERANKMMSAISVAIPHNDFLDCFIQPDHLKLLRQVNDLIGDVGTTSYHSFDMYVNDHGVPGVWDTQGTPVQLRITVYSANNFPVPMPRYASMIRADAPQDKIKVIVDYLNMRIDMGYKFGAAIDALRWLNHHCSDMRAFRACFPALTTLLTDASVHDKVKAPFTKLAQELDYNKTVKSLPGLPREVTKFLHEVSETVNAVSLLPKEFGNREPNHAYFQLHALHMGTRMSLFNASRNSTFK